MPHFPGGDQEESLTRSAASLRTPDLVEKRPPDLVTSRRMLLPLLGAPLAHPMGEGSGVRARESGEREGVRAVVSAHFDFTTDFVPDAESGVLSLLRAAIWQNFCNLADTAARAPFAKFLNQPSCSGQGGFSKKRRGWLGPSLLLLCFMNQFFHGVREVLASHVAVSDHSFAIEH